MFKIFINDGSQEIPEDDIFYIVSKEGIFLKKKLGIVESITKVENISILQNMNLMTRAKLHIPKIPVTNFAKVAEFFKEICDIYRGEAIVLIYYNQDTGRYKFHVPYQLVSPGALNYLTDHIPGYDLIGDIHSHGRMSAFHSGIDDHDEKYFDGIHITLGDVSDENISISSSLVINGTRFDVDSDEYIEGIIKIDQSSYISNVMYSSFGKPKYTIVASDEQKIFNRDWLSFVEEKIKFTTATEIERNDCEIFTKFADYKNKFEIPKTSTRVKYDPDSDDYNPCSDCVFKDYKIDMILEELTEEDTDDREGEFYDDLLDEKFRDDPDEEYNNYLEAPGEGEIDKGFVEKSIDFIREGRKRWFW